MQPFIAHVLIVLALAERPGYDGIGHASSKNFFGGKAMTTLTLELPPEVYHRLHEAADRLGKPPQVVVQEWLIERLSVPIPAPDSERAKARRALRAAGLLVEQRRVYTGRWNSKCAWKTPRLPWPALAGKR